MLDDISPEARAEVERRLSAIEADDGVRILFAVESGSRAWGFASPDSDYDCRFLYVRPLDGYLALFQPRDVIERPILDLFDVNGWDLTKALKLIIGGNSVIQEWLASPIVYRKDAVFVDALAPLAKAWRSVYADAHHYHGLLATQHGRHLAGRTQVNLKKYFYVIRPAIALQWLREKGGSPPMDLPSLVAGVALPVEVADALEVLREAKRRASEVGEGERIAPLDRYIEEQAEWGLANKGRPSSPDSTLVARTDAFFRDVVQGRKLTP
ncbi:MAG: nucleotidyltransferase domain-containing protein [Hyphomonadaceae bacterium]|nr:nucleotidyltransferase domain-containing protein [Hyphomonadaceae bacterium]